LIFGVAQILDHQIVNQGIIETVSSDALYFITMRGYHFILDGGG
jgi:hypothetical protein